MNIKIAKNKFHMVNYFGLIIKLNIIFGRTFIKCSILLFKLNEITFLF